MGHMCFASEFYTQATRKQHFSESLSTGGIQVQGETPRHASRLWVHNRRLVNCHEQFIKTDAG
jgi:hypothetical protein